MRTNLDTSLDASLHAWNSDEPLFDDDEVSDSDLLGYYRPRDIVDDPQLTVSRKRELLAYWGSDIHAVAGAPALRAYAFGVATTIDAIFEALTKLDTLDPPPPVQSGRVGAQLAAA